MAGTRTVHRGSHGRWAGASGGRAERVRVGRRSSLGTKAKAIASNRKVQVGVATAAVAGGGYLAYNKVNPGTTLRKSGIAIPGEVQRFGGKSASMPAHTIVTSSTHRFTTTSIGKGMKKSQHTVIEKFDKRGKANAIGYIDSNRALLGGYRVSHTYLTRANRGQGLGKQGLAAHAAHRPNRTYRASMNRSTMGQGLAKSMGAAGIRSGASKKAAGSITTLLDKNWTSVKSDRVALAKNVATSTKGLKPHKLSGKRIKR